MNLLFYMNGIYLLLGSNIGDRLQNLKLAQRLLNESGIKTLNESSIYETEPWGKTDQSWFLNTVLQVETSLLPRELLSKCLEAEEQLGRKRKEKWGSRIIDIDILYYNDQELESSDLTIPHPAIQDRKFTLVPMCELRPNLTHPKLHQTQSELLLACTDQLDCRLTEFQL